MIHFKPLPERARVLEILRYNPDTGVFLWAKNGPNRSVSYLPGCKHFCPKTGKPINIRIRIDGRLYMAHRLAWLIVTGKDPGGVTIDHRNRMPFDNRFCNLRLADNSMQSRNRNGYGLSRHKGVGWHKYRHKWRAVVRIDGRLKHLGYFDTELEAAAVAAPYFIP